MDEKLVEEAKTLGLNPSLYNLLPAKSREECLKKDIAKAKERRN